LTSLQKHYPYDTANNLGCDARPSSGSGFGYERMWMRAIALACGTTGNRQKILPLRDSDWMLT